MNRPTGNSGRQAHNGLLLINKPEGWTSHDLVARVRRLAGQKRVGHTGTLDPMATGLMAVLLGSATRLEPWLCGLDKSYSGRIQLGLTTDTDDVTGRAVAVRAAWVDEEAVRRALKGREGEGDQVPPAYSAIQVDGRRAYQAARAGRPLKLAPRRVTAHRLELTAYRPPLADFTAEVSSGYYIRSLARDVGEELGLGGCLRTLRREKIGPWSLAEAVGLETLAGWTEADWAAGLKTPAQALPHLPGLELTAEAARDFAQGKKLPVSAEAAPGQYKFLSPEGPTGRAGQTLSPGAEAGYGQYKILSPEGRLLGLGEIEKTSLGGTAPRGPFLRPLRVFPVE